MGKLIKDERYTTVEQLQKMLHAEILPLQKVLPYLASPDTGKRLQFLDDGSGLTDSDNNYPIVDGIPILYPVSISEAFLQGGLDLNYYNDSTLQYFLLSQIKQHGEINAASNNVHYQRHLYRMKDLLKDCRGTVLDVGCDDVSISSALFNEDCSYIGLDPFSKNKTGFRMVGVGEFLPILDNTIDNVIFNTSLDHILDYHLAIKESYRVLKSNGMLVISTLIWLESATLLNDSVHFHHFKEYEVNGVLEAFGFREVSRIMYSYKDDSHRYGLYIAVRK